MTLGSLISHGDGAWKYEGIGIHSVPQLIIYTLLQGTARFGGERNGYCRENGEEED